MPNRDVRPFFEKLAATIDEPVTELNYSSNFELLIAVILSAQATDVSVNIATNQLYPVANTPEAILALGEEGLKSYIKNIGLFNAKAKNVIKTCRDLIEKFNSTVPDNRKDLESLAGVGRKTANVVLNTAFGQPTMAVDTHIFRVGNRTGLATGKNVLIVERNWSNVSPMTLSLMLIIILFCTGAILVRLVPQNAALVLFMTNVCLKIKQYF
tara:strand:- start:1372 stop:2007 length:636 start_codon:yes stop_codon:yes gene_type:complete